MKSMDEQSFREAARNCPPFSPSSLMLHPSYFIPRPFPFIPSPPAFPSSGYQCLESLWQTRCDRPVESYRRLPFPQ
jgi:hypothetical protein